MSATVGPTRSTPCGEAASGVATSPMSCALVVATPDHVDPAVATATPANPSARNASRRVSCLPTDASPGPGSLRRELVTFMTVSSHDRRLRLVGRAVGYPTQTPPWHPCGNWQVMPQPPQLNESTEVSTQTPMPSPQ